MRFPLWPPPPPPSYPTSEPRPARASSATSEVDVGRGYFWTEAISPGTAPFRSRNFSQLQPCLEVGWPHRRAPPKSPLLKREVRALAINTGVPPRPSLLLSILGTSRTQLQLSSLRWRGLRRGHRAGLAHSQLGFEPLYCPEAQSQEGTPGQREPKGSFQKSQARVPEQQHGREGICLA